MKRKGKTGTAAVLEKMNYSDGSIVEKWQRTFQKTKTAEKPKRKPRKAAAVKTTVREGKAAGPALRLIQAIPAVFRLERKDNPTDFEHLAFAIRACQPNHIHTAFRLLHVEETKTGSRVVGCDGKRLHVAEIRSKIKGGNYKPLVSKDLITLSKYDEEVKYPAWPNVIPAKTKVRGVIDLACSGFGRDIKQTERLTLAVNAFIRQTKETINLRYLEDLPKKQWLVKSQSEKGKAVILTEMGAEYPAFAVLMPLPPEEVETAAKAKAA